MTTTGRIVAMASYPDYNPNVWTNGISQSQFNALFGARDGAPAVNWATQGQYAPGSTWKVTSTAAAVADGYPLDGSYDCPASVNIGGHVFINDGEPSLGAMSPAEALIQSCDTVFYNLGYEMWQHDNPGANVVTSPKAPVQKMQQMALDWGFGKPTGIDLPDESTGTVPTREWLYYLLEGQRATPARTGASTATPTAATSSRSSTRTATTATCGSRARRRSPRSARAMYR